MNGIFVLPSSTRIQFQKISTSRYGFVSKYELTLSLETGAFKYASRARYFFVMQISLSMLVFFLRVITWNVLATVVFQLEMFLKRKKKTVSAIVELEEDVCLYEEWGNGWVGRFRVFQLPGTVEGGGTLFWAAAFPRIDSAFCAAKNSFFKSMRWSNCNSTFLLAQAAGTKYKISGNFIIFEIRLSKINNKTNGNSNCGQFHLRYIWKIFDAFSSLNLGRCYFSV